MVDHLILIPCVNIVIALIVSIDLAKSFGKSEVYGIGIWLLGFIFVPILGFGSDRYIGPAAAAGRVLRLQDLQARLETA
jgi:hypothetical protein